jgi:hypothetical protein
MNTVDQDSIEFETHDIYLAAYLKISGCEMLRRRRQGQRVYFIFTNPGGSISEMRTAYFSGKGKVTANVYAQEIMNFKNLCFDPDG